MTTRNSHTGHNVTRDQDRDGRGGGAYELAKWPLGQWGQQILRTSA